MAVQRRVNWVSQQRVDVPDLRSVESASSNDFDQLLQTYILSDLSGYILRGFDIAMTSAIGGASTGLQMNVSNAALFHPFSSQSGTFFVVPNGTPPATLNSSVNSQVVGAFTPNSQNFVGIEYERSIDDTTDANVYIWDPTIDDQTTSVLPRANIMNFQIVISTGTWATNVMPVATVTTDAGNNVLSIEDNRPLLFRLGTAGTTAPNIFYSYPWNAQPEGRVEDPVLSASNAVNPFQGGDKMLFREKDWYDAVMTRFKEITGSVFWYSLGSFITNINLTDLWFDSAGSLLTMRGKFIHSQTTPGMLTWTGNLFITSIVGPMQFEIAGPASVTLNDTQVAYVSLVREQNFQPSNTFTFINGSNTVTATALIGGIVEGDWIVFFSDSYDDWAQVESVSGTTIVLTAPYTGSSSTGIALRSQGLYTMQVASPTDVPPTENTYWIAKRQDNGAITATIAASPTGAVNVGGILTITTTAPSGVNAGQGVQLSGITDVAASYTGIIPGTVTSVTLTANNTGPLGDLITLAFTGTNTIATAISTWNTANPSNQLTLTSGIGTQIPSAGNLTLTGGFTFNGFYEVLTTPTTTTFTVQGTGTNNASSGGGTVNGTATIYLRGIGEVSQGESSSDDSSAIEAILEYIGAESAGDTQPQYDSTNYVTQGIDLTSAIGILDARAGTQSENSDQDRSLKLILGGDWSFVGNATTTDTLDFPNIEFYANIPGTPGNSISLTFNGTFATVTDTVDTPNIVFTADNTGIVGNSISLTFDGFTPVGAVVNAWNVANTSNTVSYTGAATVVPAAGTWSLSGGGGSTIATVVGAWNTANPGNTVSYSGSASVIPQTQTINLSGGSTPTLSWSAAAAIQVPGIASSANNIVAGSVAFTGFDQVAYVNINRSGAGGNIAVTVAPIASLAPTIGFDNMVVIARYTSDGSVIVGSHSFRLIGGESKPLDAGMSDQSLTYIGSDSEAQSTPLYPSKSVIGNSDLTTAIGKIDKILSALTNNGFLVGQGEDNPIQSVLGVTSGNVATWNGYQWVSAPPVSAIPASYELLNLGLSSTANNSGGGVVAQSTTFTSTANSTNTSEWWGQSFTTTGAVPALGNVIVNLSYATFGGPPTGPMYVAIYSDNAGQPGTLLGTSNSVDASTVTTSAAPITFTFTSGPALAASTLYWFVWQPSGVTFNGSTMQINYDSTNPYSGGNAAITMDGGSTWTPTPSDDLEFQVNGVAANTLTIALKQFDGVSDPGATPNSVKMAFRSPTITSGAFQELLVVSALGISIPNGATLGLVSGINQYIYVYAINNSGTVILGVSASDNIDEGELQNTFVLSGGATTSLASYTPAPNYQEQFSANNEFAGQKFIPTSSGPLNQAVWNLYTNGVASSGPIACEIHADSSGLPGALIETSSSVDASTLTSSAANYAFTFSGSTTLNSGTTYHIVLNFSGVTYGVSALINISSETPNGYGSGVGEVSTNSGVTWSSLGTSSFYFQVISDGLPSVDSELLYATVALSNVPIRLIGRIAVEEPTSGIFTNPPEAVALKPFRKNDWAPGMIGVWAGPVAPEGFLFADGPELAVEDFPDLFANIGTTWGAGTPAGASQNAITTVADAEIEYASYTGTISGTLYQVTITANNSGTVGNSVVLPFDGTSSIATIISNWNTANPSNQVTLTYGDGTQVPSAQNIDLSGGQDAASLNDLYFELYDQAGMVAVWMNVQTYATGTDTMDNPPIIFTASTAGPGGNSISLVFDGVEATAVDTIDTPNITFTANYAGTNGNSISLTFDGVQATVTDTADTPNITFTADYAGTNGNSISLVFDGVSTVATVVGNWNTANPTNTVSYTGLGTVIPLANTWTLSGGSGDTIATIVGTWNTSNPYNTVSYTGSSSVIPIAQTVNLSGGSGDSVSTVVGNWNTANPNNQVAFTGSGSVVPIAQTVNLSGGSNLGTQPTVPGANRYIQVNVSANDSANQVASDVLTSLVADTQFQNSSATGNVVTAINTQVGPLPAGNAGDSPFTVVNSVGTYGTFYAPDLRGEFLRGLDAGAGRDLMTYGRAGIVSGSFIVNGNVNATTTISGLPNAQFIPIGASVSGSGISGGTVVTAVLGPNSIQISIAGSGSYTQTPLTFSNSPSGDFVGTYATWMTGDHQHGSYPGTDYYLFGINAGRLAGGGGGTDYPYTWTMVNGQPSGETAPISASVMYIIKY